VLDEKDASKTGKSEHFDFFFLLLQKQTGVFLNWTYCMLKIFEFNLQCVRLCYFNFCLLCEVWSLNPASTKLCKSLATTSTMMQVALLPWCYIVKINLANSIKLWTVWTGKKPCGSSNRDDTYVAHLQLEWYFEPFIWSFDKSQTAMKFAVCSFICQVASARRHRSDLNYGL